MNGALLLLGSTIAFVLAYFLYGKIIERILGVDPNRTTPAHSMQDGVDYIPALPAVLFGHHFASIAGAGPIVGPILAAYFGWGSVLAWVVLGCIFIGAAHDMIALYLSVRNKGESIASVIELVLGKPGRLLFLLFCWSTLILVCAEFTRQVAATFLTHPDVATSSLLFIMVAATFGVVLYYGKADLYKATMIFVPLIFVCVGVGMLFPLKLTELGLNEDTATTAWIIFLLFYCFLASTLPVWILLQPRDYLNSYLLYVMMFLGFIGVLVYAPSMKMEPFTAFCTKNAAGGDISLFPVLFVTVACGACSGFHSLVASGTTSKQIANEKHIRIVGYGSMLLEGVVAVLALIAVGGTMNCATLTEKLRQGITPVSLFASGIGEFCTKLGIPRNIGITIMSLAVSEFLMTSVDTATRLGRFTWQELVTIGVKQSPDNSGAHKPSLIVRFLSDRFVSTAILIALIAALLLGNKEAAKNLWGIFASANQLLAALTLLTASLWLYKNRKAWWVTLFPMLFMLSVSGTSLYYLSRTDSSSILKYATCALMALSSVMIIIGIISFLRVSAERKCASKN